MYKDNTYISTQDLLFMGVLNDIKKSKTALQPIFEAFTNAIEAVKDKLKMDKNFDQTIYLRIDATKELYGNPEFHSLSITDPGIGFNNQEFKRFNTYKDFTKGYKNLGSGRIQYAHYFDNTTIKSVFTQDNRYFEREFVVSKKEGFLKKNAIVLHNYCKEIEPKGTGTKVTFHTLLENSNIYNDLTATELKKYLLERYIHYFCCNKEQLPAIEISYYVQSEEKEKLFIAPADIPDVDATKSISIPYSKAAIDGKAIEKSDKTEQFTIDAFKVKKELLRANKLSLVSKGEIVEDSEVSLKSLAENDNVQGHKYLFLVSGEYIDDRDSNARGELKIPTKENFHKNLFKEEEILLEDIEQEVNHAIDVMYPDILEVKQHHEEQFEQLKKMFLLDDEVAKNISISINDSESKILEKFYEAEAKKSASIDASIKESIDKLNRLDTRDENYAKELKNEVDRFVKMIPLQNKLSLTHYVARRKLVLELFQKILNKHLQVQQDSKTNFDEALIHNLLFQQHDTQSDKSDLWIINEDFIYFKGSSEKQLNQVEIDGKKLFKEQFSEEEEKYLLSLGENRKLKRPDILLFPEEGKCIIIEIKAPEVNAADHLTQIDMYANLIRNYTNDTFQITTFYGYLIGENIEKRDVLARVSSYEQSYQFDYLYRPSQNVIGFDGRSNGSIYTEVLKYSTLLARAKQRNEIFINKLRME